MAVSTGCACAGEIIDVVEDYFYSKESVEDPVKLERFLTNDMQTGYKLTKKITLDTALEKEYPKQDNAYEGQNIERFIADEIPCRLKIEERTFRDLGQERTKYVEQVIKNFAKRSLTLKSGEFNEHQLFMLNALINFHDGTKSQSVEGGKYKACDQDTRVQPTTPKNTTIKIPDLQISDAVRNTMIADDKNIWNIATWMDEAKISFEQLAHALPVSAGAAVNDGKATALLRGEQVALSDYLKKIRSPNPFNFTFNVLLKLELVKNKYDLCVKIAELGEQLASGEKAPTPRTKVAPTLLPVQTVPEHSQGFDLGPPPPYTPTSGNTVQPMAADNFNY
ncbi:MAG: hypothetical protein HAW66_02740 [Shewanella sp.]|nr:hypothetical protein [Shewanella sp.]